MKINDTVEINIRRPDHNSTFRGKVIRVTTSGAVVSDATKYQVGSFCEWFPFESKNVWMIAV